MEVIPVNSEAHGDYASKINRALKREGIRSHLDDRNEKLGYRIREAQMNKVPIQIVVGNRDIENETVTVRTYGSKEEVTHSFKDYLNQLVEQIAQKSRN